MEHTASPARDPVRAHTADIVPLPGAARPPAGPRRTRKMTRDAVGRGEALCFGTAFNDRARARQVERWSNATPHDLAVTLAESLAYVLSDEQRARFREFVSLSATRHPPPSARVPGCAVHACEPPVNRRSFLAASPLALAVTPALAAAPAPLTGWDRAEAIARLYGDPQMIRMAALGRASGMTPDDFVDEAVAAIEWDELRRQLHPKNPAWPAIIRQARRHGLTPDDVEGAYVTLHGPDRGALTLAVTNPATGAIAHLSADGALR